MQELHDTHPAGIIIDCRNTIVTFEKERDASKKSYDAARKQVDAVLRERDLVRKELTKITR